MAGCDEGLHPTTWPEKVDWSVHRGVTLGYARLTFSTTSASASSAAHGAGADEGAATQASLTFEYVHSVDGTVEDSVQIVKTKKKAL